MSRMHFTEPPAEGSDAVEVDVRNWDHVSVMLTDRSDISVIVSFWQLARIVHRIRAEFASQLDREAAEHAPPTADDGTPP